MISRSVPVIAFCLLWLISAIGHAQSIADSVSRSLGRELKIREALDEDTRLEFIECPLEQICDFLTDLHAISVQIDKHALEKVGLAPDVPVTRNLKGVSLRSALNLLLDEHDLSWVIHDEVLLITTRAAAKAMASVRVHNVSDLLAFGDTADRLASTLEAVLGGQAPDEGPPVLRIVPFQQVVIVRGTEQEHRDIENLLLQIRTCMHGPPVASRPASPPPAVRAKTRPPSSVKLEWGVGERVRYGLVGFMDFDGDGKSDRELLRTLIISSKGILDAEVEDDGEVKGRMSIHTHYLVVGDPPPRSKETLVKPYVAMMAEGERLGIQKVSAEKMFRKLQEHAAERRKREEREAAKKQPPDPFGGGANPFGGGGSPFGGGANPFGAPAPPAKPKSKGADPFAAPAPPPKPRSTDTDPFGAPVVPAKPKDTDADPFGGAPLPAKPKGKDPLAEDPFGEREPSKSDKPKEPSAAPKDPFG